MTSSLTVKPIFLHSNIPINGTKNQERESEELKLLNFFHKKMVSEKRFVRSTPDKGSLKDLCGFIKIAGSYDLAAAAIEPAVEEFEEFQNNTTASKTVR